MPGAALMRHICLFLIEDVTAASRSAKLSRSSLSTEA
jgi:hypothetical protein